MFCPNYTNKMPLIYDAENRCNVVFTAMEADGSDPCPCNKRHNVFKNRRLRKLCSALWVVAFVVLVAPAVIETYLTSVEFICAGHHAKSFTNIASFKSYGDSLT